MQSVHSPLSIWALKTILSIVVVHLQSLQGRNKGMNNSFPAQIPLKLTCPYLNQMLFIFCCERSIDEEFSCSLFYIVFTTSQFIFFGQLIFSFLEYVRAVGYLSPTETPGSLLCHLVLTDLLQTSSYELRTLLQTVFLKCPDLILINVFWYVYI